MSDPHEPVPTPPAHGPFVPLWPKHISRLGFWVISMAIMALLLAIAIPNFVTARATTSQRACPLNLKHIDGAVRQWALENNKVATDTYSLSDPKLLAYIKGGRLPVCPAGGHYSPGTHVGDLPKCSVATEGHTL